jgi:predicted DNA-binding transcriptional regulator YafY
MVNHLASPEKSEVALLKVRRGKARRITAHARLLEEGDEWSIYEYPFTHQTDLLSDVLWHLDDVELLEPITARVALVASLEELVGDHV